MLLTFLIFCVLMIICGPIAYSGLTDLFTPTDISKGSLSVKYNFIGIKLFVGFIPFINLYIMYNWNTVKYLFVPKPSNSEN